MIKRCNLGQSEHVTSGMRGCDKFILDTVERLRIRRSEGGDKTGVGPEISENLLNLTWTGAELGNIMFQSFRFEVRCLASRDQLLEYWNIHRREAESEISQ